MENLPDKKILVPYNDNEEHLKRHTDKDSLTMGSKIIRSAQLEDMEYVSELFDKEYAKLIEQEGNPGRRIFAVDCKQAMGTDAVVPSDVLREGSVFTVVREPGTRGEAKIKVALIDEKDMPKTSHIHAVYGPYGPTGKAGVYTLIFGDPGMPFPRELGPDATKEQKEVEAKNKQYWDSHVFLVTPKELSHAIEEMKSQGMDTKIAELHLKMFERNPSSPMIKGYSSEIVKDANVLEIPVLPSIQRATNKYYTDKQEALKKP